MTTREFIGWWMESLKTFKGTVPSCGRFDHKRGYTWDNFEMQDMAANSREGMLRNKTNIKSKIKYGKKVFIKCKKSGEVIAESSSIRDVARIFDVSQRLVQKILRGTLPQSKLIPFTIVGAA